LFVVAGVAIIIIIIISILDDSDVVSVCFY